MPMSTHRQHHLLRTPRPGLPIANPIRARQARDTLTSRQKGGRVIYSGILRTCATRVHVEIVFRLCRNVNSVNLTASLPPFGGPV